MRGIKLQTPYLKRLLSLLLFVPFIALSAPIPKKRSSKQLMVTEATCLKYSADPKQCAPVDLDLEQIQNVVLSNPNRLTCNTYQLEIASAVTGGICKVGGRGGGSGSTVNIASHQNAIFNIPRASTNYAPSNSDVANRSNRIEPASFTGTGVANLLTTSVRNGVGHINVLSSGSLSITLQDQITVSRLNITSGGTAQLSWQLVQWSPPNEGGAFLRSWTNAHVFNEPISSTNPLTIDIGLESGLIPVEANQQFTLRFFFSSSQANKEINFNFPADPTDGSFNDRFEFLFYPPATTRPFSAMDRTNLENAVLVDLPGTPTTPGIELSGTELRFYSLSGNQRNIDLSNLAADTNPITIRNKLQELHGNDRLDATSIKNLPSGGGVALGPNTTASFQIPVATTINLSPTAQPTLRPALTAPKTTHKIPSFTGNSVAGVVENSVVSDIARLTIENAGYVNIVFEDEVQITRSTAGGSGNVGELIFTLVQYNSSDEHVRTWVHEHPIEDPITNAIKFPVGLVTGLTPVSEDDYFTFKISFNTSRNTDYVSFDLPADNADLDERLEVIYFPTKNIVTNSFLTLADVPNTFAGQSGKFLTPNEEETALVFVDAPTGGGSEAQGDARLIALSATPTDLTPYANGQILRIQPPATTSVPNPAGEWLEVLGADAGELHSFQNKLCSTIFKPRRSFCDCRNRLSLRIFQLWRCVWRAFYSGWR